jgi:glutaredoxin 3
MVNAQEFVKQKIADSANGVVVFSKTYCPYCKKAKELFKELKANADVIELDTLDDGDAIQVKPAPNSTSFLCS